MTPSVYFVTPDAAMADVEALVAAAARGGATVVQLRDKTAPDAAMIALARRLRALLAPRGIPLIVNDRVEVMLASEADGLHVGQSDAPVQQMRARIGADRLLGLSIETEAQLRVLPAGVVDYIGAGPVRATGSKADHAAPIGMDGLARICAAAPVPAVAIGGIGPGDAAALKAAGARGMAVISAIAAAQDPEAATRALADEWRQA